MVNIFRLSKYITTIIIIIAVAWLISKRTEAIKTLKPGENRNNEISGFDKVMFELTEIMGKLSPSSPLTRQMTRQMIKQKKYNH